MAIEDGVYRGSVLPEFADLYSDKYRALVFWSGRSTGKSHAVAESQIVRGLSKPMRFLDTREIQGSIKDSVKALLEQIIHRNGLDDFFIIQKDAILGVNGSEWIFKGLKNDASQIKSFADIDEAWVEEAQNVSYESLRTLFPTIRKAGSRIVMTGNRLFDEDPYLTFFDTRPELKKKTLIKYLDPLTLDRYGLQPQEIIDLREAEKGNPDYAFVWLGEPLSQIDNAILDRKKLVEAFERDGDETGDWEIGVDVARFGADRSVLVARKGMCVKALKIYPQTSVVELVDYLRQFIDEVGCGANTTVKVDDTGVGGGVTDLAKSKGLNVIGVNFAQSPKDPDHYPNANAEMWFDFAKQNLDAVGMAGIIEHRQEVLAELSQRGWTLDNRGRRAVQSKGDFKAGGNRSPDLADALLLSFYEPKMAKKIEWW